MSRAPTQPALPVPAPLRGTQCPNCGMTRAVSGDSRPCTAPDCPSRAPVWLTQPANEAFVKIVVPA